MTYSKNVANLRKTSSLSSNANMERDKLLNIKKNAAKSKMEYNRVKQKWTKLDGLDQRNIDMIKALRSLKCKEGKDGYVYDNESIPEIITKVRDHPLISKQIQKMKNRRWNKYNELEDKEDIVFVDEDSDDEGEPGDGNVAAASNTNSKRGTKRQRGSDVIVTEPPRKKAKKAHNKKKQQNKKKNKPKPSSTLQISDGFSFL
eukprot:306630_1